MGLPLTTPAAGFAIRKSISTAVAIPYRAHRADRLVAKVFKPESDSAQEGQANGAPDWRSVPKEAMALFETAQEHMLTLNNSRLKALEELKISKKRIAELQVELDATKEQLAAAQSLSSQATGGAAMAPQQPVPVDTILSEQQDSISASYGDGEDVASTQTLANTITIRYATGWNECFVHFNADGNGWTEAPGWKMSPMGEFKELVVEGSSIEFCLNNGGQDWDSPPGNYVVNEPGVYVVSGGMVHKQ